MPKKTKKVASLSGSLLRQDASNPAVGFVLTPQDDVEKKPTERHSGANRRPADGGDLLSASERPRLHAVTLDGSPQSEQPRRQADVAEKARVAEKVGHPDFLAALREGNLSRAEEIFGELTGLEPLRAKRVLYGPGGRNLTLACKALGFEQLQLVSILILTRKLGPNGASLNPHQLTELVSYFGAINEVNAESVLNQWRTEHIEVFGEQS